MSVCMWLFLVREKTRDGKSEVVGKEVFFIGI